MGLQKHFSSDGPTDRCNGPAQEPRAVRLQIGRKPLTSIDALCKGDATSRFPRATRFVRLGGGGRAGRTCPARAPAPRRPSAVAGHPSGRPAHSIVVFVSADNNTYNNK